MECAWSNFMPPFPVPPKSSDKIESAKNFEEYLKNERKKDADLVLLNADLNQVLLNLESAIKSCQSKESSLRFCREHSELRDLQFGLWNLICQLKIPCVILAAESVKWVAFLQCQVQFAESLLQVSGEQRSEQPAKSKPCGEKKASTNVVKSVASKDVKEESRKEKKSEEKKNGEKSRAEELIGKEEGSGKFEQNFNEIKIQDLAKQTSWEKEKQLLIETLAKEKEEMLEANETEKTELKEFVAKQKKDISELRELLAKERHDRSEEVREMQRQEEKVKQKLNDLQEKEKERRNSEFESSSLLGQLGNQKKKKKKSAQKSDDDDAHFEEENAKLISELEEVKDDYEKRLKAMKTSFEAEKKKLIGHNDLLDRKIEILQREKEAAKSKPQQVKIESLFQLKIKLFNYIRTLLNESRLKDFSE